MTTQLGRPKDKAIRTFTLRLKEKDWLDLRRCALINETTMSEWIREQVKRCKRNAKAHGTWTEATTREEYEQED